MLKTKILALVQVCVIGLIIIYSTYQFFLGHFEEGMSALPFLIIYYIFVTARQKRKRSGEEQDEEDDDSGK